MRVLFLDIDGVLNSRRFFANRGSPSKRAARRARGRARASAVRDRALTVEMIDPAAVAHLNAILDATGAICVLSSSWRLFWPVAVVEAALRERGFTGKVADRTANDVVVPERWADRPEREYVRGLEIADWICFHPGVESLAILDDCDDMAELHPYLVQTDSERGLEAEHVARAIALLGRK